MYPPRYCRPLTGSAEPLTGKTCNPFLILIQKVMNKIGNAAKRSGFGLLSVSDGLCHNCWVIPTGRNSLNKGAKLLMMATGHNSRNSTATSRARF